MGGMSHQYAAEQSSRKFAKKDDQIVGRTLAHKYLHLHPKKEESEAKPDNVTYLPLRATVVCQRNQFLKVHQIPRKINDIVESPKLLLISRRL